MHYVVLIKIQLNLFVILLFPSCTSYSNTRLYLCPEDTLQTWLAISICVLVWKSSFPVHPVVTIAFIYGGFAPCGFISAPLIVFLCHPFRKLQLQTFLSQEVCDCFNLYQFLPFIYFTKLFGLPLKMYNKMDGSDYLVLSRPCTLLGASTTTSKAESWLPSE